MISRRKRPAKSTLTTLAIVGLFAALFASLAFQPSRAVEEQPPRPPTATPFMGTRVILSLEGQTPYSTAWWTVMQWQDETGGWHDVNGWQGTFDENRQVVWWVGPEHFGSGPFRWVVYDSAQREQQLALSKTFNLPLSTYASLEVKVTIP